MSYNQWPPYIPVAKRREIARKKMDKLREQGKDIQPIEIQGRTIAKSFWGRAWCEHLERFSDYSNRLPRGRTYARNGSVCHLEIKKGRVEAMVSGSSLYHVTASVAPLNRHQWETIKKECAGQISSALDLLQGKLSDAVMGIVTDTKNGMYPQSKEIELSCDCSDWADMCKHIAAVLYGVGARLDHSPQMLFLLRGVDYAELIDSNIDLLQKPSTKRQVKGDLSSIFGIDLENDHSPPEMADDANEIEKNSMPGRTAQLENKTDPFSITAKAVTQLRKRFAMTAPEFAQLIGVSPQTVKTWEQKKGVLTLIRKNSELLQGVTKLDKSAAWSKLEA
jgi:uncharacterized Zn finger protein